MDATNISQEVKYKYIDSPDELARQIDTINEVRSYCVLDIECDPPSLDSLDDAKNPHKARLVDIQLTGPGHEVLIFPDELAPELLKIKPAMVLVGHNLKYDLIVLHRYGVDLTPHAWRDTMIMDHLIDENRRHSLGKCVENYFGVTGLKDFWEEYNYYTQAPEDVRWTYGATDIMYTERLYREQLRRLDG